MNLVFNNNFTLIFLALQASMTSSRVKYSSPKVPSGTWKGASVVMAKI